MPPSLPTVQRYSDLSAKWLMVSVFAAFPIALGLTNLLMALAVLAWLLAGNFGARWQTLKSNPVAWFLLALYGLILVHGLFSPADWQDISRHLNKYCKLLISVVFMSLLTETKWIKRCGTAFVGAMLFILVSTYLNVWLDLPWSRTQHQGLGRDHTVIGDHITQNIMMAFFVLLCLVQFQSSKPARTGLIWLALAVASSASIIALSAGRTGFILLSLVVLVFFLYTPAMPWKAAYKVAGCLAIAMALLAAMYASPLMKERFEIAYTEARDFQDQADSSVGVRLYIMTQSIELIAHKPVFGYGTASYHALICTVLPARTNCHASRQHPDNQYVMFGIDHGLLGVGLLLGLMVTVLVSATQQTTDLKILMLGFSLMLFVNSFFSSSLWTSRQNHFFLFVLALLAAQAHSKLSAKKVSSEPAVA